MRTNKKQHHRVGIHDRAHAESVQARRVAAGRRGYAKAVRRWFSKHAEEYKEIFQLPVRWDENGGEEST